MVGKKIGSKWFIRLQKGEELIESLRDFCSQNSIYLGSITGIGACNNVTIGMLNTTTKKYKQKTFSEDMELTALMGNVCTMNNEVYLHLHGTFANEELIAYAGHLNSAVISATGEIIIDQSDGAINRFKDESIGINLWKIL
ncbi:MAG: DNA-binding protein [Caldisericia bacterium]|nr:DNA-binding protein [Caldisericia bacterium]